MATKNGVCPYCNNNNRLENRIFKVNPEASLTYCPSCMREIEPSEAINLYTSIIDSMLEKADNSLFVACDPLLAYQEYADVLEVEPLNSRGLLGRIICLIYTSKVRQAYLVEAQDLLELVNHKGTEEVTTYVSFLKKINLALDEYDTSLIKKLTHKKNFYDEECVKLYLKHLSEIINFKINILNKLKDIKRDYVSQNNEVLINLINHNISEKESVLKSIKNTVNGAGYRYTKIYNGNVCLEKVSEPTIYKINKNLRYTLKEDVRGKRTIKDRAFKDYTPILKAKKASLFLSLFLFIISLGGGVAAYIYCNDLLYFSLLMTGVSIFFVASIVMIILHFSWKSILKKRKMRID